MEHRVAKQLDFRVPASRTMRKKIYAILSHPVYGTFYSTTVKIIYHIFSVLILGISEIMMVGF